MSASRSVPHRCCRSCRKGMRRQVALVILLVAASWAGARAAEPAPPARNVIFVISDDQHWRDYGFMGHPHLRTPHLDRLARESLVFRRGYVPSSLCCPSLASIITGRYPHEHRICGNDPPDGNPFGGSPAERAAFQAGRARMNAHFAEWPTVPALLARHGYASLQTGKWWQGDFARGGFTEGMTKGERHGDAGLAIGRTTMQPIYDFVARCRRAGTPFFVWYAPMLPHDPHDPPRDLVDHYASTAESIHVARYWGNIERFDRTVGDLLDHLDREKIAADTLVVYVTDNGWLQNPADKRCLPRSKTSPYEGGLRTPIMLRQPGTIEPGTSDALATSLDIAPTVLAACGAQMPAGLPGVNLLDAAAVAARRQIFGECFTHTLVDSDDPGRSLMWRWTIRDRWKLIVPAPADGAGAPAWEGRLPDPETKVRYERGEVELFDVVADPDETRNVAAGHADVVRDLRASLDGWWKPVAAAAPGPAAGAGRRPANLLVFLADDLGARDLGCTGSTFYRTPAIDALGAAGMRFTRAYAACPVCSPTRAALVTGRHPARVGITNFLVGNRRGTLLPADYLHALPDAEVTVAELLQAAGHATGVFGKWHLGPPQDIAHHGFTVVGSTNVAPGSGPPDDPMHGRAIARQAAAFIESHRAGPFFCYVPTHSVHVPLKARADLLAEERRRAADLPARAGPRDVVEGDRTARAVQDLPVYAAMIRELDETVAMVLDALDRAGRAADTLVVFTSDNGGLSTAEGAPTSNRPLRAGKGYLYEGGIRVPLLVRWPGVVAPGTTCDVPVTTADIAATLLDAGGVARPPHVALDGTSLRPLLEGSGTIEARDLVWHYPHYSNQGGRPAAALLAGDGATPGNDKLGEHFEDQRLELVDVDADPEEAHDLAALRPQRAADLHARLVAWRKAVGARLPQENPRPVDPFSPEAVSGR